MQSQKLGKEALEAWNKVTCSDDLKAWHQKYTPHLVWNEKMLDMLVQDYDKTVHKLQEIISVIAKTKKCKEYKAIKILKKIQTQWKATHYTDILKCIAETEKLDGLAEDEIKKIVDSIMNNKDRCMELLNNQVRGQLNKWRDNIKTKFPGIDLDKLELIIGDLNL